jgi:hypothetical protein
MKFWTVLFVTTLGGPFDGEVSYMVYPSMEACETAAAVISQTLPYDHKMECEATTMQSSSIRPKRNPFYGEGE